MDKGRGKLTASLETIANVAIIGASVMLGVVLVKSYLLPRARHEPPSAASPGTRVGMKEVDWAANRKTLLLSLRQGCQFCAESAPFYRRLVAEASGRRVKLIALVPQAPSEGRRYLAELGVGIEDVRDLRAAPVASAVPTILLVNHQGVVVNSWLGKLRPDQESDVLAHLD